MGLGIVLHAAIAYMHWPLPTWPVRDADRGLWADGLVYAIHAFRMPLFFVLAGYFAFVLHRREGTKRFLRHRWLRIGVPFLGALILVQPQLQAISLYRETAEHRAVVTPPPFREYVFERRDGEPLDETVRHFTSGGFLGHLMPAHLWFLYYLLLFYAAWLLVGAPRVPAISRGWLVVFSAALLWPMRTWAVDSYAGWMPQPRLLAFYGLFFLAGIAAAGSPGSLVAWSRRWKAQLVLAFGAALPVAMALTAWGLPLELQHHAAPVWVKPAALVAEAWFIWLMVGGLLGAFEGVGPRARYWADASYWCYLMGLTPVLCAQIALEGSGLPGVVKFLVVTTASTGFLLSTYALFVRYSWLGNVLHGKRTRPDESHPARWDTPGRFEPV